MHRQVILRHFQIKTLLESGGTGSSQAVVGRVGGGEDRGSERTGDAAAVDEEEFREADKGLECGQRFC